MNQEKQAEQSLEEQLATGCSPVTTFELTDDGELKGDGLVDNERFLGSLGDRIGDLAKDGFGTFKKAAEFLAGTASYALGGEGLVMAFILSEMDKDDFRYHTPLSPGCSILYMSAIWQVGKTVLFASDENMRPLILAYESLVIPISMLAQAKYGSLQHVLSGEVNSEKKKKSG
jgi:hypothetical protein